MPEDVQTDRRWQPQRMATEAAQMSSVGGCNLIFGTARFQFQFQSHCSRFAAHAAPAQSELRSCDSTFVLLGNPENPQPAHFCRADAC